MSVHLFHFFPNSRVHWPRRAVMALWIIRLNSNTLRLCKLLRPKSALSGDALEKTLVCSDMTYFQKVSTCVSKDNFNMVDSMIFKTPIQNVVIL